MVKNQRPPRGRYLENGPHTVEVTTRKPVETRTGIQFVDDKTYVVDKVLVQPSAGNALKASEYRLAEGGLQDETVMNIMGTGRDWPGGPHSRVRVLVGPRALEDIEFQQSGHAVHYKASPMTEHFKVRIDAIGVPSK